MTEAAVVTVLYKPFEHHHEVNATLLESYEPCPQAAFPPLVSAVLALVIATHAP
jgi:hypothetical protein